MNRSAESAKKTRSPERTVAFEEHCSGYQCAKIANGTYYLPMLGSGSRKSGRKRKSRSGSRDCHRERKVPEIDLPLLKSVILRDAISKFKHESQKLATGTGRFTGELDHALPGKHTKKLYDRLSRGQAVVLSQLRTEKNQPNYYLAKAKITESETCECKREPETVGHIMLGCPRRTAERAKMLSAVEDIQGIYPSCLGGGILGRALTEENGNLI